MKRSARFLSMALVIIMAVSLFTFGVSAKSHTHNIWQIHYNDPSGSFLAYDHATGTVYGEPISKTTQVHNSTKPVTVTAPKFIYSGGQILELTGSYHFFQNPYANSPHAGYMGEMVNNGQMSQTIPAAWHKSYNNIIFAYGVHKHVLPENPFWYYDDNNHWTNCAKCGDMMYNWHHDVDNDGICDECKQPIVYRTVTVKDAPGGKVTVSKEKCMLSNRVAISVTPDEGYQLQEIHGVSTNGKNWIRPCYQDVKGSQYHMIVDVFDVEIQPTFVKQ